MADFEKITKKRLGELLVAEGVISQDQVAEALKIQEKTGEMLGEALVKAGFTTETEIAKTLCTQFAKPFLRPSKYDIPREVMKLLPVRLMAEHQFVPIDKFGNVLVIAMAGLIDGPTFAQIQKLTGCEVEIYIAASSDVKATLRKSFPDLYDPITMHPKFDALPKLEIATGAIDARAPKIERAPLITVSQDGDGEGPPVSPSKRLRQDHASTTGEVAAITAEEENDWEALFEEAEQNVMKTLKSEDSNPERPKKGAAPKKIP